MNEPKTDWDHIDPKDPKGYYAYFGVSPDADLATITAAYMKTIKECSGNSFVINEANRAYEVLSNVDKQRLYDSQYIKASNQKAEQKKEPVQRQEPQANEFQYGLTMGQPSGTRINKNVRSHQSYDNKGGCSMLLLIPVAITMTLVLFF